MFRLRPLISLVDDLWDGSCVSCGLSDCDSVTWTELLVVDDVLVSPSSALAEMCEGVSSVSDWEVGIAALFVLQNTFVCAENQGEMRKRIRIPEEG